MRYDKRRHTAGDIVEANRALESIAQMLWRERLQDREVRYVIEGSNQLLSQVQASAWLQESAHLGYTEVRFLIAQDDGRAVVIELVAISPLEAPTDD